jgi:nickel-type superoxide dismutase maturation protease
MKMKLPIAIYRVAERSMEPTLMEGDYILVWAAQCRLAPRDMVVMKHPASGITLVKRVRLIEGARIYVEGDNGPESEDSRDFGAVEQSSILGKVIFKV